MAFSGVFFLYFDYEFMELVVTIIDLPLYTLIQMLCTFFFNLKRVWFVGIKVLLTQTVLHFLTLKTHSVIRALDSKCLQYLIDTCINQNNEV